MARIPTGFNLEAFLAKVGKGKTMLTSSKQQILFAQGDATDAVFYIQAGKVKVAVVSKQGKEAVVAILAGCGKTLVSFCFLR